MSIVIISKKAKYRNNDAVYLEKLSEESKHNIKIILYEVIFKSFINPSVYTEETKSQR